MSTTVNQPTGILCHQWGPVQRATIYAQIQCFTKIHSLTNSYACREYARICNQRKWILCL